MFENIGLIFCYVPEQVQHLQKVLTKKRDPVSHVCFIDEIIKVRWNIWFNIYNCFKFYMFLLCMTEELNSSILFVKSHWEVMCVDNVHIPWVKSLSLICSDLLQRIFVCCPCLHSPCWFTCCWHISSKWHPNWCLQVAGPSVTRLSTPHAYTHAHTYIHHTFSARQWWDNFIYILHLALGDFVN